MNLFSRLSRRRRWVLGIAAVLCVFALAFVLNPYRKIPLHQVLNPAFWVLHWRGLDRYNEKTALLEHGNPDLPEIAITIDDGPDPKYLPQIVSILKQNNVPATFFLVGIRVKKNPELVTLLDKNGFEIANHTYDHQRLDALKPHEIANELRLCDSHIAAITGRHLTLMRPPGMQYNDKVLHVAKSQGYVTVSWTVGAKDYEPVSAAYIQDRVIKRAESGSIILLHQDNPQTALALPGIIATLRQQGYRFVTISTMLAHLHAKLPTAAQLSSLPLVLLSPRVSSE